MDEYRTTGSRGNERDRRVEGRSRQGEDAGEREEVEEVEEVAEVEVGVEGGCEASSWTRALPMPLPVRLKDLPVLMLGLIRMSDRMTARAMLLRGLGVLLGLEATITIGATTAGTAGLEGGVLLY